MQKVTGLTGDVRGKVSDALDQGLASHDALTGALFVAQSVRTPFASLSFVMFMRQVYPGLKDPGETHDGTGSFSIAELDLFRICALMSSAIYTSGDSPPEFPPAAGQIVFNPNVSSCSIPFAATESPSMDCYFIAFRGSYCFADFITDAKATPDAIYGGLMHSGVVAAAEGSYAVLEGFAVHRFSPTKPKRFIFTGHSLGAAVAAAVTHKFRLCHPEIPTEAVIFGPAASVSRKLWVDSTAYCTAFILSGDFVPYLSLHNLTDLAARYLPDELALQTQRKLHRRVDNVVPVSPVKSFDNPFLMDPPSIEEIRSDLEQLDSRGTTALYPPGRLFLYSLSGGLFQKVALRVIPDCDYFGRLVKGISEENHSMSKYAECASELFEVAKGQTVSDT
jgi:hypothetical protein